MAFACSSGVDIVINIGIGKVFEKTNSFNGRAKEKSFKGFLIYFFRAYGSTFFSQLVDNIIFQMIAYPLLFKMPCTPFSVFIGALLGAVFELVMEILFAPVGFFLILKKDKKEEEILDRHD